MLFIAVSFAPLILIGGAVLYQFDVSYHEKIMAHLEEVVRKHMQSIDAFLTEGLAHLIMITDTFTTEQQSDELFLREKLAILQRVHGGVFVDLGYVDKQGVQIAYASAFRLGKVNYAEADWFKKAATKDHFVSDVFLGVRQPHFLVTARKQ
ncbi:MAG: hypothetical protein JRJ12_08485 [Deltaproteobacteria bacterium]|nr:hypothetical protein [Deltaproteobacteria bacterium]MBW2071543.1 hypothetical protein [Deltaproteobacteria bacterium]